MADVVLDMKTWLILQKMLREYTSGSGGFGSPPRHQRQPLEWNPENAYIAKTGSAIPALSGTTPGTGTVTLYGINDDGDLYSLEDTREAYNLSAEVAADTWIMIKLCVNRWVIDFEACPA